MSFEPFGPEPPASYDYLDSFEQDYKPEQRFEQGLEVVADGDHEFEIINALLTTTKNGHQLLQARLKVDNGITIKHVWFHNTQPDFNAMCADLCLLGFDADKWGKGGKPLREALPAAVQQMAGRRFRGVKRTEKPTEGTHAGKTFHKLYINGLLKAKPMPSPSPNFNEFSGSAPMTAAPVGPGTDW